MKITNKFNLPVMLQVWALYDNYDYNDDPWTISATTLLKSTKQVILGSRLKAEDMTIELADLIPSRLGTAVHDSIEKAWINRAKVLPQLGLSEKDLNIEVEQRKYKQVGKWTISGKYDVVKDGSPHDYKTTSVFSWIFKTNDQDYIKQLSIYRWLSPEEIYKDTGVIHYIFTDWQKSKSLYTKDYPRFRIMEQEFALMSLEETEQFIKQRVNRLERFKDSPEVEIPDCTDEELWRAETVFKYYADPSKRTRSTKNFTSYGEALAFKNSRGGVGVLVPFKGEPKKCLYCPAFNICQQRKRYYNDSGEYIE